MNDSPVPSSDAPAGDDANLAANRSYVISAVAVLMVASAVFVVMVDRSLRQQTDMSEELGVSAPIEARSDASSVPVVIPTTPNPVIINLDFTSGPFKSLATPTIIPARRDNAPQFFLVKVRSGDTLAALASRHGNSFDEIASLNAIDPPYLLRVGDELLFPNR